MPNDQGGCDIELPAFQAFVEGLYDSYSSTRNPVLHGMIRGLLIASLILLEQAGASIALKPEHEDAFWEEKVDFGRAMG